MEKQKLYVIPLRGMMVFPKAETHLDLGRSFSVTAANAALENEQNILLVFQKTESSLLPHAEDIHPIAVLAKIKQQVQLPVQGMRVLVQALERVKITSYEASEEEIFATYESMEFDITCDMDYEIQNRVLCSMFREYMKRNSRLNGEAVERILTVDDLQDRFNLICSFVNRLTFDEKYRLLECDSLTERMKLLIELLIREEKFSEMERDLNEKVKAAIDKNQREFYLREKMRVISEELGEGESRFEDLELFRKQLEESKVPDSIREKFEKEIRRLAHISPSSPEYTVSRNYLETVLALPWQIYTEEVVDLPKAQQILDAQHYGLKQVKNRILDSLAVRELRHDNKGSILCLVGPPGVGKTSLAKSIAEALQRNFIRLSLGGVRDEAELRGHRRTYIGAMPGRIIRGLIDAKSANPVMLLDEIDKMSSDFRGDPSAALLEILDAEQNVNFSDHYVEVPFDLSQVLFITTANRLEDISKPLLDRMEIIEISSYTDEEKTQIAMQHLLPKQEEAHGLPKGLIYLPAKYVKDIIHGYTREAGVRELERQLATLCRKAVRGYLSNPDKEVVRIRPATIERALGKPKYSNHIDALRDEVGKVNGLAWTSVGGEVLSIEAVILPGKGEIKLTGQMGDVMKESAQLGFSYLRSISKSVGLKDNFYEKKDLHLHIPAGATPKEGPSAGISMATAMISAFTGKAVRKEIAMTGELTLRGKVLPIGGVKEKVLAAYRIGCTELILPKQNERDLDDIPEEIRNQFRVHLAETMDDVLAVAFREDVKVC